MRLKKHTPKDVFNRATSERVGLCPQLKGPHESWINPYPAWRVQCMRSANSRPFYQNRGTLVVHTYMHFVSNL